MTKDPPAPNVALVSPTKLVRVPVVNVTLPKSSVFGVPGKVMDGGIPKVGGPVGPKGTGPFILDR
jgi:hypothetical protein